MTPSTDYVRIVPGSGAGFYTEYRIGGRSGSHWSTSLWGAKRLARKFNKINKLNERLASA